MSNDLAHQTLMPFGKYKGEPLKKLPVDYLKWLLKNGEMKPELRKDIEVTIKKREIYGVIY